MSTWAQRYLHQPAGQSRTLDQQAHRPWPIPGGGWLMGQSWLDLLFAHWPVDASTLREHVPDLLPIDEHDGTAWLGITPFRLESLRMRATWPLPVASNFPELNVRTYVTVNDRPGIFFLRLDTPSLLAIAAARAAYQLPYAHSSIEFTGEEGAPGAARVHAARDTGSIDLEYEPRGPVFHAVPGSLEYFLTERYRLYTVGRDGAVHHADIHHPPWPLQVADCDATVEGYLPDGLDVDGAPLAHVSARQDVVIWPLTRTQLR